MSESQKTIDRINTLIQRTEANGASEAEENTAARMVCKLLRESPELLGGNFPVQRRRAASETFNERTHPDAVSVQYERVLSQDDQGVDVVINGTVVWLPFRQIKIKTSVILMPRTLAVAKGLIQ